MPEPTLAVLPLGAVARHFGVPVWKVRRLYERAVLPPAERVGNFRVVRVADLPDIESALHRAGYLPGSRRFSTTDPHPRQGSAQEITDGHPV
jgi:hypothetical protein